MKFLKLTLALLFPMLCCAQNLSLKLGPIGAMAGQISFSGFMGMGSNHYYYGQFPNVGKHELIAYDFNHRQVSKSGIEIKTGDKMTWIREIVNLKNSSYAFSAGSDAKTNQSFAYMHKLGADGKPQEGVQVLESDKNLGFQTGTLVLNMADKDYTGLYVSPDSSHVAITESTATKTSKNERLGVFMYDENLNKKWEKEVTFPFLDGPSDIRSTFVTNDGRVIITVWFGDTKNYRHKKIALSQIRLFVVDANGMKEINCDFSSEVSPSEARVVSCTGNEITVAGLYDKAYDCTVGAFAFKADIATDKILSYKLHPVKMEDLDFGRSKGELKKQGCIESAYMVSALQLADGTILTTLGVSLSSEHAVQTYDKLIFAFDKDLTPKYSFGIKGWTSARPVNSVMTVPLGGGYAVIYLDNDARGNVLALYVNSKGERTAAQKFPIGKMYFRPENSMKIDDQRVLIEGEAFGNYQFGVLSLSK